MYEINKQIIDLSEPLITDEASEYLRERLYDPIDTDERSVKNAYKIIENNGMYDLLDEKKFGDILAPYSRIMLMEGRRYAKYKAESK